ncbi:hypothetical protein O181_001943 [Austropuccinia psidii MF-1]|uniref:Uncharacterized protein n=1 Tax=Austropuccinia psidii MF-1 TaxID=1389203 RepID=A0A9Q3BBH5_9BASI|nr:hypothetical protein [Austropuccinia psidii MF-1]
MESTIIQTTNQKDKAVPCQKEGGSQGRSPSSFHQQVSIQPTSSRREETIKLIGVNHIPQDTGFRKSKKMPWTKIVNMARILIEFKDKEEQIMRQLHFQKKNSVS